MATKVKIYNGYVNFEEVGSTPKATAFKIGGSKVWFADAMDWKIVEIDGQKILMVGEKLAEKKSLRSADAQYVLAGEVFTPYVAAAETGLTPPPFPFKRPDATADDHHTRMGGRGYNWDNGFAVSNNSLAAREAGCHPASYIDKMFKLPAGFTAWAFECREWHDTSGKFNRTIHYSEFKVGGWINESPEEYQTALKIYKEWKKNSKKK